MKNPELSLDTPINGIVVVPSSPSDPSVSVHRVSSIGEAARILSESIAGVLYAVGQEEKGKVDFYEAALSYRGVVWVFRRPFWARTTHMIQRFSVH